MKIPLQIAARDFELTEAIEQSIRERARKLDSFCDDILRCRVVVEAPHRHQHKGILYKVDIHLTMPGEDFVVTREAHEDLYVAIRDAFDAARRRLQDLLRKVRGDVKHHEEMPTARVSTLLPERGYGFLTTSEGREIYFHEHSVLEGKFSSLKVGMEVHFVEESGEKGPQASTVRVG